MTIKRMLTLQCVVLLGLGSVFLVPKKTKTGEAGVRLELPTEVGLWTGKTEAISARELRDLASDTGFARRSYTNPFGDEILVSIVLSGADMNNSIHRPERCLPTQGWTVEQSSSITLPVTGDPEPMKTTRLENVREVAVSQTQRVMVHNLQYYWFIGARDITASHWERTFIDIKDRVLLGENQHWAYVTVASNITDNLRRFGRSEAETSKMVEEFITQLAPTLQRPDGTPAMMTMKVASR